MSPEAIHSLIEMFGVEKGLHILNLFTAMDDTELSHTPGSTQSVNGQVTSDAAANQPSESTEQIHAD